MMLIGKHTKASFCLFSLLERGAKSYVDEMRSFLAIHFSTRSPFFLFLYSEYNRIIVQYIKINVIRPNEFFFPHLLKSWSWTVSYFCYGVCLFKSWPSQAWL